MHFHGTAVRREALDLLRAGTRNSEVAEQLGVPLGTVSYWLHMDRHKRGELPVPRGHECARCDGVQIPKAAYSYLLGLYLGDGYICPPKHRTVCLQISLDDGWPGIQQEAADALSTVFPGARVGRVQRKGCSDIKVYSQHLPCLFPQAGRGKKHERPIILEQWQQDIVDEHPWPFVRGLIHSDGCRTMNWTTRLVNGERKRYEYPRYWFTNVSDDIRRLYTDTLDKLGIEWKECTRHGNPYNISVARRASVALMDARVGPKY